MDSEFPLLNSLGFGWGRGPEIRFAKKSYSNFQKCPFCFPGHQNDPWILFKKWALVFLMDFVCSLPFLETLIYIYIYTWTTPSYPGHQLDQQPSVYSSPQTSQAQPRTGSKEFVLEYPLMAGCVLWRIPQDFFLWLCFGCGGWDGWFCSELCFFPCFFWGWCFFFWLGFVC